MRAASRPPTSPVITAEVVGRCCRATRKTSVDTASTTLLLSLMSMPIATSPCAMAALLAPERIFCTMKFITAFAAFL